MADLFTAAAEERLRASAPLAARLRPRTIDDVVGQDHLVGAGRPLRRLVEQDRLTSAIFWGPPGTGKTTLALAVAGTTARAFEQLSAVTAGVKDVREVIERARQRLGERGQGTILFLDEIHRFTKAQQDALLPAVEDGTLTLIGATTENPFFEVNPPLRSRSTLFRLEPLDSDAMRIARRRAGSRPREPPPTPGRDRPARRPGRRRRPPGADVARGGLRARPPGTGRRSTHVEAALGTSALRYGRDDHYDVISAFIKSMRGSDPDAAIYWLARMLEAGEDARFIARRMVIFASEDVGMADPQALLVAVAAAHALEHVGLPEAQLNLAQAAIHLATAPKSNRAALAIWNARTAVRDGALGEVPAHLRDAHYQGAKALGHGTGYEYPHDHRRWLGRPAVPARRAHRPPLVRAEPARLRGRGRTSHGRPESAEHGRASRRGVVVTAGDLAVTLAAVLCCARVRRARRRAGARARRAARRCAAEVAALRAETRPLLAELRDSTAEARSAMHDGARRPRALRPRARLGRGDQRRGRAVGPGGPHCVLGTPVIKTAGLATGTGARRAVCGGARTAEIVHVTNERRGGVMKRVTWFVGGVAAGAAGAG